MFGDLGNIRGEDSGKRYLLDPWLLGGNGIKAVLCLPCTEIQMPVQPPYLPEDPVSQLGAGGQPLPSCGGTGKNVPLPDFIPLACAAHSACTFL